MRQALRDDLRRARRKIPAGALLVLAGCGLAAVTWKLPTLGTVILGLCFGLMLIPLGLAVIARAACTIAASRRRLREVDERTALPVARVRPRRVSAGAGAGGSCPRDRGTSSP